MKTRVGEKLTHGRRDAPIHLCTRWTRTNPSTSKYLQAKGVSIRHYILLNLLRCARVAMASTHLAFVVRGLGLNWGIVVTSGFASIQLLNVGAAVEAIDSFAIQYYKSQGTHATVLPTPRKIAYVVLL